MANEKLECKCGDDKNHAKYVEKNGEVVVECAKCGMFLKFTENPVNVPVWTKEHEELSKLQPVIVEEKMEEIKEETPEEEFEREFNEKKNLREQSKKETQIISAHDVGSIEEVLKIKQ